MATDYTPVYTAATERAYAGRVVTDPLAYTTYSSSVVSAKYFGQETTNEILALWRASVAAKEYQLTYTCLAGLNVGDPVYLSAASTATLALATTAAASRVVGFVAYKPTTTTCYIDHYRYVSGLTGLTAGNAVYLTNAGGFSATAGTIPKIVGVAITTTTAILFGSQVMAHLDTTLFSDTEGDPVIVNLTAAADGTSVYAARRDHRHLLDVAIAPTWTGNHAFNGANGIGIGATAPATGTNNLRVNQGGAGTVAADCGLAWTADISAGNTGWFFQGEFANTRLVLGGYQAAAAYCGLWLNTDTPADTNYVVLRANSATDTNTYWNTYSGGAHQWRINNIGYMVLGTGGLGVGTAVPATGTNILLLSESDTDWTSAANASIFRSKDSAAGNNNIWAKNEVGILKQLTGLDAVVASDVTNDSATLATITGLSLPVVAAGVYKITGVLHVTLGATLEGVQVAIAGTATATNIIADVAIETHDGTPIFVAGRISAMAGSVSGGATVGTPNITVYIDGVITVNAAGTLLLQGAKASDTGAAVTTFKRGSSLILTSIL